MVIKNLTDKLATKLGYRKLLFVMMVGVALTGGCRTAGISNVDDALTPTEPQSVTREIVPIETTAQSTDTPTATIPPTEPASTPTSIVAESPIEAWEEYTNTEYGFSFRYPSSWTLVEELAERPNTSALVYSGASTSFRVGFKRVGEEVEIGQYGGAAGDFVSRGTVVFLGEAIEKSALVYQEVDREIHYNGTSEITRGDLVFTLAVKSNRRRYEEAIIPEEIQALADEVVASFELIE